MNAGGARHESLQQGRPCLLSTVVLWFRCELLCIHHGVCCPKHGGEDGRSVGSSILRSWHASSLALLGPGRRKAHSSCHIMPRQRHLTGIFPNDYHRFFLMPSTPAVSCFPLPQGWWIRYTPYFTGYHMIWRTPPLLPLKTVEDVQKTYMKERTSMM